ncbi:MAG: hypothetical protein BWX87_02380 [Bacteroidetes bacterium ADurb.Bin123]|nr:MAG: hypothetical protein BWX87_02380 [Bacteroidetes bacterium ADurb.Bin123]
MSCIYQEITRNSGGFGFTQGYLEIRTEKRVFPWVTA